MNMPLFYQKPEPLEPKAHGKLKVAADTSYSFTKETNAVPLLINEFIAAARSLPIFFVDAEPSMPIAILSLRPGMNVFHQNGAWKKDTYIPAYVRRYPFIFLEDKENDRLILSLDVDASMVNEKKGEALFEGEEATPIIKHALDFCGSYQAGVLATQEFVKALEDHKLLTAQNATVQLESGEQINLNGFRLIDEKKLQELDAKTTHEFHQKGWLSLITAHMISLGNLENLISLHSEVEGDSKKVKAKA